jgi:hypothetical protein
MGSRRCCDLLGLHHPYAIERPIQRIGAFIYPEGASRLDEPTIFGGVFDGPWFLWFAGHEVGPMNRLRWFILGWFEGCIQTLITRRLLAYHGRLVDDGFIPDLYPPYRPRLGEADTAPPNQPPSQPEPADLFRDG